MVAKKRPVWCQTVKGTCRIADCMMAQSGTRCCKLKNKPHLLRLNKSAYVDNGGQFKHSPLGRQMLFFSSLQFSSVLFSSLQFGSSASWPILEHEVRRNKIMHACSGKRLGRLFVFKLAAWNRLKKLISTFWTSHSKYSISRSQGSDHWELRP